jgi:HPt (histidine-containing phosphotransfer) domain-containing protein
MLRAEAAHMATGPCAALLERVGGDADVFRELCGAFLDDAPKRLAQIRAALDAGDASRVRREAHAFKGAAAAFDAEDVVSAARGMEQLAASGDLRESDHLWRVLESCALALIEAVRDGKERG